MCILTNRNDSSNAPSCSFLTTKTARSGEGQAVGGVSNFNFFVKLQIKLEQAVLVKFLQAANFTSWKFKLGRAAASSKVKF